MQVETTNNRPRRSFTTALRAASFQPLVLPVLLMFIVGVVVTLAYQLPNRAALRVGWLGDQLFLPSSEGLGAAQAEAGDWYGDELADHSPTGRSRWMRQKGVIELPGLGNGQPATLVLTAQGWPADALSDTATHQPTVTVRVNGHDMGSVALAEAWADYSFELPATVVGSGSLRIELVADHTFTATESSAGDTRPKAMRLALVRLEPQTGGLPLPPVAPLGLLALAGLLAYAGVNKLFARPWLALALATALVLCVALGLGLARIWVAALLPWLDGLLVVAFVTTFWRETSRVLHTALRFAGASGALDVTVLVSLAAWAFWLVAGALGRWQAASWPQLALGVLLLVLLAVPGSWNRVARWLNAALLERRVALVLLGLFLLGWIGYEAVLALQLPGVGHADYSDNAVVARNLVHGRGWVVDYVTQFYKLYPSLTRPQETWPLLQPVWIAPFLLIFGDTDWAAKLPNLVFTTALGLLVYGFGARFWDRRVGLTAAILILTSYLFVLLVINVTSDLGFVIFAFAVVWLVYERGEAMRRPAPPACGWWQWIGGWWSIGAGVLTGLMFLQKPSNGVFLAVGCGLWLLFRCWQLNRGKGWRPWLPQLLPLLVWAGIATVLLSPYLLRNLGLAHRDPIYGSLVYSTESRDAWILEYASGNSWAWLYKIYTPEAGLSETQGLPDRSWLLRWGFDRVLTKIGIQAQAVRDYIGPAWEGMPADLSGLVSGRTDKRLFFELGSWLAVLGALAALRGRRDLVGLLLLGFVPYTAFLVLYWHANEERYFVALMPWLAVLAALALWRGGERLLRFAGGRFAAAATVAVLALAGLVVAPSFPQIGQKIEEWHRSDSDRLAYAWLRENTAPADAVMTRVPWQLNWHAERPALMIPATTSGEKLLQLARYYGIRYLVIDVGQRPDAETRALLDQMLADPTLGFTEVYTSPVLYDVNPTRIYRFPADYGGVPELRP